MITVDEVRDGIFVVLIDDSERERLLKVGTEFGVSITYILQTAITANLNFLMKVIKN